VDQPGRVDGGERLGDRGHQVSGLVLREGAAVGDSFGQVRAVDVLGDQVGGIRGQVLIEHSGGARDVHAAQRVDFPAEPGQELLVPSEVGVEGLHRDAGSARGASQVDRPHPAAAEPLQQCVLPQLARVLRVERFPHQPAP
jgi:hypothetical protein